MSDERHYHIVGRLLSQVGAEAACRIASSWPPQVGNAFAEEDELVLLQADLQWAGRRLFKKDNGGVWNWSDSAEKVLRTFQRILMEEIAANQGFGERRTGERVICHFTRHCPVTREPLLAKPDASMVRNPLQDAVRTGLRVIQRYHDELNLPSSLAPQYQDHGTCFLRLVVTRAAGQELWRTINLAEGEQGIIIPSNDEEEIQRRDYPPEMMTYAGLVVNPQSALPEDVHLLADSLCQHMDFRFWEPIINSWRDSAAHRRSQQEARLYPFACMAIDSDAWSGAQAEIESVKDFIASEHSGLSGSQWINQELSYRSLPLGLPRHRNLLLASPP